MPQRCGEPEQLVSVGRDQLGPDLVGSAGVRLLLNALSSAVAVALPMEKQYSVCGVARLAVEGLPGGEPNAAKAGVQPYQRVVSGGGDDPGVVRARVAASLDVIAPCSQFSNKQSHAGRKHCGVSQSVGEQHRYANSQRRVLRVKDPEQLVDDVFA
jgi:hypothetical protein